MNRPRHSIILSLTLCFGTGFIGVAWATTYLVKKGESLSQIVSRKLHGPIWGQHGNLQKVLAQNPNIRNKNLIFPGQRIELGASDLSQQEVAQTRSPAAEDSAPPKPLPAQPVVADFKLRSLVSIAPVFSFSKIQATDVSSGQVATLGSDLNYGFKLGWEQFWSDSFDTGVFFSGTESHYSAVLAAQNLDHSRLFLGDLEVDGSYHLTQRLKAGFLAGVTQEAFARGESTTSSTLDSVVVPNVGLSFVETIYSGNVFHLLASEKLRYLVPVSQPSYQVSGGYSWELRLALEQGDLNKKLEAGIFFSDLCQKTSISNQDTQWLGFYMSFAFDFFAKGHE